ncbi:MAG: hypothetical protein ABIK19_06260, partial [candidate division WOR-3 bacterium]
RAVATFDCSNVITKAGLYNITYRVSGGNIGSSTAWLELTYMNNPNAKLSIFGTEYRIGDYGTLWLQLINSSGQEVDNGVCFVTVYYPDKSVFLDSATMSHLDKGIYYYDLVVPYLTGVYPAIAKCYYTVSYITETADSGTIWVGTNNQNDYTKLAVADNVFWKIDEALSGGNYHIDFVVNYTGITEPSLLNSLTIHWKGKWNGQAGDYINFNIWNCSSNSWVTLPNKVPNTAGASIDITNTIETTNLTKSGLLCNGQIVIRINDTNITDATKSRIENDYLVLRLNYFTDPYWQEVKGASELHVSGDGQNFLIVETNCGDETSNCGVFTNDNEFEEPEGEIEDNITIISMTRNYNVETYWEYTTPFTLDCTAVYWIKFWNGSEWIDVTDTANFRFNPDMENCHIEVPITLNPDTMQEEYHYRIKMDNYMKWEVEWSKDYIDSLYGGIYEDCQNYAETYNYTYEVPISESTNISNISTLKSCHRLLDDFYWFYYYYNESLNYDTVGEYTSYVYETRFYRQEILRNLGIPKYFIETATYNKLLNLTNQSNDNYLSLLTAINSVNSTANQTYYFLKELNDSVFKLNESQFNYFQQILAYLQSINHTLNTTLEYKLDLINGTVMQINQTTFDIIQHLVDINNSITQYLVIINDTTYQINQSQYQDYISLLQAINSVNDTQNWQYIKLLELLLDINATGNTTLDIVASINQTLWNDIIEMLKDINYTTNTTLEYKLDLINYTTWHSWIMLQNLTIGNVTVSASINWTEGLDYIWNATTPQKIKHDLLSLSQQGIQMVGESYVCLDNMTLQTTMNITNCMFGICENYNRTITTICAWGCQNNQCLPQPSIQFGIAILIVLIISLIIYLIWRFR